jgi:tetratricopeptide (TPR) repeat protein
MNLDYSSDRTAFSQLVRGHWVGEALRSRELGRAFFDAAMRVAPTEAFLHQQRGIYEMDQGDDLGAAEEYLERAKALDPNNRSIQHSFAVLARRQALATGNRLLRQRLRERARSLLAPLVGLGAQQSYGFHTAAQIELDDLEDLLRELNDSAPDTLAERRIVELAREFERFLQEGLQKSPLNEHLLALDADYRRIVSQHGRAELALRKAFDANPRQDWIAIRLARMLDTGGKRDEGIAVLVRCLQVNPNSKRVHFELALLYMRKPDENTSDLILDHLRRSFTTGDHNYEAQFWYARQAFVMGRYDEATKMFAALRSAPVSSREKNQIRGTVVDGAGRSRVFTGEIANVEPNYLFIRSADFPDNVFAHRSVARDFDWDYLKRGINIAFTVGFSMRGVAASTLRLLN